MNNGAQKPRTSGRGAVTDEWAEARLMAQRRAALEGAMHAAMDNLHQITGHTDQTPQQIAVAHPDHPAVAAYHKARDDLAVLELADRAPMMDSPPSTRRG
jgi:hypothetical protein